MNTRFSYWHWHNFLRSPNDGGGAGAAAGTGDQGGGLAGAAAGTGDQGGGLAGAAAGTGDQGGGLAGRAAAIAANAGDGQGNGQGNGQGAGVDEGTGGGAGGAAYYPEGMADEFRGASDKETIDKLAANIAARPKPPAKADDYKLALSPDFTKQFGDLKDDKVLPIWREVAHELGLDDKAFNGSIEKLYAKLDKAGLIDKGPDPDAELAKLMPKTGDQKTREIAAAKRVNDAGAFLAGLETAGLGKNGVALLAGLMDTAEGIATVEFLKGQMGEKGLQAGGQAGGVGSGYTHADAQRDMADERYSTASPKIDPAFRKAADARMATLPRKKIGPDGRLH